MRRVPFSAFRLGIVLLLGLGSAASADTFTGTVGKLNVGGGNFAFTFSDASQTQACNNVNTTAPNGYAFFSTNNGQYKELYAMLLLSKKGATIVCTSVASKTTQTIGCQIVSCELQ